MSVCALYLLRRKYTYTYILISSPYLLEICVPFSDAVSVSQSNAYKKLPIHLLFESDAVANREDDTKYLEIVFQLLRANPETVMVSKDAKQASIPQGGRPSRSGNKRKYCA